MFHEAARTGKVEDVQMFLDKEADVNARSPMGGGKRALHEAALGGHKQVVEILLAAGAEVDSRDNQGTTLLIAAVNAGYAEVAKLLLSKGADVNAREGRRSNTPLRLAVKHRNQEMLDVLRRHGAEIEDIFDAARAGRKEMFQLLLSKGAYAEVADNRGRTPALAALRGGHREIVMLLRRRQGNQ